MEDIANQHSRNSVVAGHAKSCSFICERGSVDKAFHDSKEDSWQLYRHWIPGQKIASHKSFADRQRYFTTSNLAWSNEEFGEDNTMRGYIYDRLSQE